MIRRLTSDDASLALETMTQLKMTSARLRDRLTAAHMASFLGRPENVLIVATSDGRAVGFLLGYFLDRPDRLEKMMLFYEIEVAASHRRRGIARAMVDLTKKICAEERVFKMWVLTNRSNAAACALYRSTGGIAAGGDDEVSYRYEFAAH